MTKENGITNKLNFLGAALGGVFLAVMLISGFILYTTIVFHDYHGLSENRYSFLKWSFIISGIFFVLMLLFIVIDFIVKKRKNHFVVIGVSPVLYCFKTMGIMILSFLCAYFIMAVII